MSLILNQFAIRCGDTYGPAFGAGHDLYISNKCNENNSSYCKFPHSYNSSKVYKTNQESITAFSGLSNFKVVEYEVYRVVWDWNDLVVRFIIK